ncbi:MAG: hypothetical protein KatS3mg104_2944 [Phycisphaerae bacterium]|nr:MAG: hypothetical protein KatS3mg104_2944 [Phycisphaerae bacterium]
MNYLKPKISFDVHLKHVVKIHLAKKDGVYFEARSEVNHRSRTAFDDSHPFLKIVKKVKQHNGYEILEK